MVEILGFEETSPKTGKWLRGAALFSSLFKNDKKSKQFSVGDRVRVKYRGQEGTIIDISGNLYMVSMKDGGYVDSYVASDLEKAW